jgi:UDP-N-acetylmuramoylalanine--D-glutamate ligase
MQTDLFKGKRITVMGLGLLGRGLGDSQFLAERGAELIVTDLKTEEQLESSVAELKSFSNITSHLGGHKIEDFKGRDFILKAAGVPIDSPFIAEARKNKIPIKMSASWFAELTQIPTVGVTGTRGKSTTTELLYQIMKGAGMQVLLGGNVKGISTLALLPQITPESIGLFELDSWQLQGWGESNMSPNIAVFTTFLPDHLNYYKGNMDAYLEDKVQIFLYQKPEDVLVVSTQVLPILKKKYGNKIVSKVVVADPQEFPKNWNLKIPGEHNKLNAMCAIEAARALGIDDEVIKGAVESFKGVPGRLELLKEVRGVKIYNDTTATTPDATLAALRALDTESRLRQGSGEPRKNIVLIMGGSNKGLDMSELMAELPKHCKATVLLAGSGTDRIKNQLQGTMIYHSVADAVYRALAMADSGDIILFSPAFASFGMFKNEFDRGEQFVKLVQEL